MIRYLRRALSAHLRSGRAVFLLTLFGVALGVASVLSIQILNSSALGAFEGSLKAVSGEADLSLFGQGPRLPEGLYPEVLATPGVAAAWPIEPITAPIAGHPDLFLEIVGVDLFAPRRIPWSIAPEGIETALGTPGWVAIGPELGRRLGLHPGDRFGVELGSRRVTLTVGALVDFKKLTPLASPRLALLDIAQAQDLFGGRGSLKQIDVRLAPEARRDEVIAALRARLGPAIRVLTPEARAAQAQGLLGAFRLNLTALSLISLFVGLFLVYSSTQASLVRRREELGLLRVLGATRAQMIAFILFEVLILGVLGVAIGLPLGEWVARANVATVSATLSNLYLLEEIETLRLPPTLWLLAGVVGIGGALAGALVPAVDMSRRDPRALLASYTLHERIGAAAPRLALAALALLAGTALAYPIVLRQWKPGGFVVGLALLVAMPLATPYLVRRLCGLLRGRSFGFAYGLKSLGARLQTSAVAVAALAIAVAMLVGITLMIGSFRRTVELWVDATVRADVYVSTTAWRRARGDAALEDSIVSALAAMPGVRAIDRLRQTYVFLDDRRVPISGIDMSLEGGPGIAFQSGDPHEARRRAAEEGAVLIGEPLARRQGLGVGGTLTIPGPAGPLSLPIAGVYYDYSSENGSALVDLKTMEALSGPGPIQNVALYLEPGRDPERMVEILQARFAGSPLLIRSNRSLRNEVVAIFDQTFAVTRLLQAMSLLVAACGITLTLLILARERIAELALYRALGARRLQIARVFLGKGLAMAALGLALGTLGGFALAFILIVLVNRAYFGWTIALHWPWEDLLREILVILAVSFLASLYPALRAGRTSATELSHDE